jgi:hypothetical protein
VTSIERPDHGIPEPRRPRVFGIGLNKTGTTSLHAALQALGYRSLHHGGPESADAVARAAREGLPLLTHLGDYDAFSDIQLLAVRFAVLDEQYPGSRFILTTRDLDGWLDSRRRHVERNVARHQRGEYDGTFLTVDIEAWTARWMEHTSSVQAHFAERPGDLLVLDLAKGAGWDVLCPFLGRPVPSAPFPWQQRGSAGRQRAAKRGTPSGPRRAVAQVALAVRRAVGRRR